MGPSWNHWSVMQNSLQVVTQSLENHLVTDTAKGFYYQAYFHLVGRVGREVADSMGRRLTGGEILFIADRVEAYLKQKVFRAYQTGE